MAWKGCMPAELKAEKISSWAGRAVLFPLHQSKKATMSSMGTDKRSCQARSILKPGVFFELFLKFFAMRNSPASETAIAMMQYMLPSDLMPGVKKSVLQFRLL